MNFQDEIKKNLRSPEAVKKESDEQKANYMLETVKHDLRKIKELLIESAKGAKYTVENVYTRITGK